MLLGLSQRANELELRGQISALQLLERGGQSEGRLYEGQFWAFLEEELGGLAVAVFLAYHGSNELNYYQRPT